MRKIKKYLLSFVLFSSISALSGCKINDKFDVCFEIPSGVKSNFNLQERYIALEATKNIKNVSSFEYMEYAKEDYDTYNGTNLADLLENDEYNYTAKVLGKITFYSDYAFEKIETTYAQMTNSVGTFNAEDYVEKLYYAKKGLDEVNPNRYDLVLHRYEKTSGDVVNYEEENDYVTRSNFAENDEKLPYAYEMERIDQIDVINFSDSSAFNNNGEIIFYSVSSEFDYDSNIKDDDVTKKILVEDVTESIIKVKYIENLGYCVKSYGEIKSTYHYNDCFGNKLDEPILKELRKYGKLFEYDEFQEYGDISYEIKDNDRASMQCYEFNKYDETVWSTTYFSNQIYETIVVDGIKLTHLRGMTTFESSYEYSVYRFVDGSTKQYLFNDITKIDAFYDGLIYQGTSNHIAFKETTKCIVDLYFNESGALVDFHITTVLATISD